MRYTGAHRAALDEGKIRLSLAHTRLSESIPASWIKESRQMVRIDYTLKEEKNGCITVGFRGKALPENQTLIIDPSPSLDWGTYYGGPFFETGLGIATDAAGNVYLSGSAQSPGVLGTSGAHQNTLGGDQDAYLAKFNSLGDRIWSTYYGGSVLDAAVDVETDPSGNILLAGLTQSSESISTSGSHKPVNSPGQDGFLAKFNPQGVRQWGTYYGGSATERISSVHSEAGGNILICGYTSGSTSGIASPGAHQETQGGGSDAFLARFSPGGVRLWGTYLGGSSEDFGYDIASDAQGSIVITGQTSSSSGISTPGAHQVNPGGATGSDAFLVKFNAQGVRQWGTYFGGSKIETGNSVALSATGDIALAAQSSSTSGVATPGAHQAILGDEFGDAVLARFSAAGVLQWATYFGGAVPDAGEEVGFDGSGNLVFSGSSGSPEAIATPGAHQSSLAGANDVFLALFNPEGTRLWASYYGGADNDLCNDMAIGGNGLIYLAGNTSSQGGISTENAHQTTYPGGFSDGFAARFSYSTVGTEALVSTSSYALFPNPAGDRVILTGTGPEETSYTIFDASGRPITRGIAAGKEKILHTGNLPPGLYLLRLNAPAGTALRLLKN